MEFKDIEAGVAFAFGVQGMRVMSLIRLAAVAAVCSALSAPPSAAYDRPISIDRGVSSLPGDCTADARFCEAKTKKHDRPQEDAGSQEQRDLLKTALAALAPQRKGVTDVYTIGVAGWAGQDVFFKELEGALGAMSKTLPTGNRVLRLINHPSTAGTPLATRDNLAAAVRGIGAIMDKKEDILILFMTSHGFHEGFALQLPWAKPFPLPPAEVANMFKSAGIRNRVLIVSACYSGIFVKPMANANTIVMTAADETHASFGCSSERDWTYFGDAFFNRSLVPGVNFRQAFDNARNLISGWELKDGVQPSNPQGYFGQALVDKLGPVFAAGPGR